MDGLDRGADDLSRAKRAGRRLRRHWLFATLLILAAALRAVVLVAYHPALIFQSIFDAVPDTGQWRCGLLLDGSIGIGGNPESLLRRVSGVLSKRGRLLVETVHPREASEDLHVRVETAVSSGPWFRWSVVSHLDVTALAATSGFLVNDTWEDEGRYFAQLERIADP